MEESTWIRSDNKELEELVETVQVVEIVVDMLEGELRLRMNVRKKDRSR